MESLEKIRQALEKAKTMFDEHHPRIGSTSSFTGGKFTESQYDKIAREAKQKCVKDLEALEAAGFNHMHVCFKGEYLVSVCFHKRTIDGAYVFENGSLLLTYEGLDKHHNGIVSAEKGEWVIAEFQDGAIDAEILKQYHHEDGWYVCVHQVKD
jgi:hypothetical protein